MIKIPGPNSAPNGDVSLVRGWTTTKHYNAQDNLDWVETLTVREKLRRQGKLRTGKTAGKHRE